MSLGCKKSQTFFKVVLPNITSGVMAAFMLAFINSFNNVPVSMFLTGPGVSTLPITMMNYVEYNYDPTVSALSVDRKSTRPNSSHSRASRMPSSA